MTFVIKNNYKKIKNLVLDILFPISCLSCGQDDVWFCPKCLKKIKLLESQVCPHCEKITTDSGRICPKCKDRLLEKDDTIPLDRLIVATGYKENGISHLVHLYKYNFVRDLSVPLGKILVKSILRDNLPLPDLIIPIPLHKRRLRWRGFNQSELLARYISENITPGFSIPLSSDLIRRNRYTKPQMKVRNYQERKKNIQKAFSIYQPDDTSILKDKHVLLVDDIATTGATMMECGKILKLSGAKTISGVVIARQEIR